MYFIGIDIGTSTISGVVYNFANKNITTLLSENDSALNPNNDWEKIQNPHRIFLIVEEILNEFCSKFDNIKGIGITGQMHGILYVDKQGNAVSPLYTWEDGRGNLNYKQDLSYANFLSEASGYVVSSGFGLVTHFYNLTNGLVPETAHRICTIMDYIVMKLSGRNIPLIDSTNAASLGFFNLENFDFDREALRKINISATILPEIKLSGSPAGLFKGIFPIYIAIGDNQASFLGSVREMENTFLVNIGTGSQISVYTDRLIKTETFDIRPFPGGGYLLVGAALFGGKSVLLLKTFIEQTLNLFLPGSAKEIDFYAVLNSLDYTAINRQITIHVDPIFAGTRTDSEKRGIISHISGENFTPENLIFGFLKGISNELMDFFRDFPDNIHQNMNNLVGSGNAIRLNPSLHNVIEETFRMKLHIPSHQEEAAFGACLYAIASGHYVSDFREVAKLIQYEINN
ncbi:MAG: FGGY family carbohydrate kinase [Bacteroidota bacterium]